MRYNVSPTNISSEHVLARRLRSCSVSVSEEGVEQECEGREGGGEQHSLHLLASTSVGSGRGGSPGRGGRASESAGGKHRAHAREITAWERTVEPREALSGRVPNSGPRFPPSGFFVVTQEPPEAFSRHNCLTGCPVAEYRVKLFV